MSEEQKVLTKEIAVQFLTEKGIAVPKEDQDSAKATGPFTYVSNKTGKTYYLRRRTLKFEGKPDTVLHYFSGQNGPVGDLAGDAQPDEALTAMPEKYTAGENEDTGLPMLMRKSTEPAELRKYNTLEDDAAALLARFYDKELDLGAIKNISDTTAASLAGYKGDCLRLNAITSLNEGAASALAACKAELRLNGLSELSAPVAKALAAYNGSLLSMDALESISDEAAAALSAIKSKLSLWHLSRLSEAATQSLAGTDVTVSMWPITSLAPATAEALCRFKRNVSLRRLTSLGDESAATLSHLDGDLDLDGLKDLSDAACESLSKHKGMLSLNGLTKLSDAGAMALGKHEGPVYLLSLEDVSDAAKKALGIDAGMILTKQLAEDLSDLWTIYSDRFTEIGDDSLEIITEHFTLSPKGLSLNGLRSVSEKLASAIAEIDGSEFEENIVYLRGIREISVEAARALAGCQSALDLSGLTTLPDDVAEELSAHKGCLYLDGLSELSDSSAGHIARHTGLIRLNGLKTISDSAAASLARDTWPVQLNVSILSDSPDHVALRAKVEAPTRFVEIGVTDPIAEVFGATKFKICWDLDCDTVTNAGFDIDWARGSVMYDFATGRAWNLEILKELIEKGVAVPYLDADFCVYGPGGLKATGGLANYGSMFTEEGQEVCSDFEPDQEKVVDIIRRVHTHALELIALKDTNHAS